MRADTRCVVVLACFGALLAAPAAAQTRMYLEGPSTAVPGVTVTYEIWLESPGLTVDVDGYQVSSPCSFSGCTLGSVDVDGEPFIDVGHPDYIYRDATAFPVTSGDCQGPDFTSPRLSNSTMRPFHAVIVTDPVYLGEFNYTVSVDAMGECAIQMIWRFRLSKLD